MENEKQRIALMCKGEDYKDCVEMLTAEGFTHQGFNEWLSPDTGVRYRLIMPDGKKYVTRVEAVTAEGAERIETEFCNTKLAIKRYEMTHARPRQPRKDEIKQGIIHALFGFSASHFTKMLQKASEEGDLYTNLLYDQLGVKRGERISIKQFLFVDDGYSQEVIAFTSEHRRYDRDLLFTVTDGRKKLYIYKAIRLPEDMIESLFSRAYLDDLLGEDEVQKMRPRK